MDNILHQLVGGLSKSSQGFIHPKWCKILFVHSRNLCSSEKESNQDSDM